MTRIPKRWLAAILVWGGMHTTSLSPAQVLPFFTDTALTVGFESNAVRTFSRFAQRKGLVRKGREASDPADRQIRVFAQLIALPVRLNPDTVLIVSAPILHRSFDSRPPASPPLALSQVGPGDLTLQLKHRFYRKDFLGGGFQVAALGGVKLPTGESDQRSRDGQLLPPSLQLGSGTVDVPLSLVLTTWKQRVGLSAQLSHTFKSSSRGFSFGDQTRLNLAFGFRLAPRRYTSMRDRVVNLYLEINTLLSERDRRHGQPLPDSGGRVLFLAPGLQWVLTPRFLWEGSIQIPVVQDLNGTQLSFAPTLNTGLRLLF